MLYHRFMALLLPGIMLLATATVRGQSVYLSEATSANTIHYDEDGSLADWLELHNPTGRTVDLSNWSLGDDPVRPRQWTFAAGTNLPAGGYLRVWASGKDRSMTTYPHALLAQGQKVRYILPDSTLDRYAWNGLDYDDGGWTSGATPLGYGSGGEGTLLPAGTQAVFLRYAFRINDVAAVSGLLLDMDYDDAFVAYLNGVEVARGGIWGDRPDYRALAARNTDAKLPQGRRPPHFPIADYAELLRAGENVLAVQVHNKNGASPDLTALPFLTVFLPTPSAAGAVPAPVLDYQQRSPHTNFRLAAQGETISLYDAAGQPIDQLTCPALPSGASVGRPTGRPDSTVYFAQPTPGAANTSGGVAGIVTDRVSFSHSGGSTAAFSLMLSGGGPGGEIRYTLDATLPTATSPRYTGPIAIDRTTVVRAALFASNRLPSPVSSRTYLVGEPHRLPTLTLMTDPDNLFSDQRGIYVLGPGRHGDYPFFDSNIWQEWERPVEVSFREPGGVGGTDFTAGIKIFGGFSRALPQRSLSLFARSGYGSSQIDYPLFPDLPYEEFQSVVLRNSGNDWMNTMLRDGAVARLYRDADLETLGYRPTVSYLNGSYWGLYNLREKINEHYLASRSGHDPDRINLLELGGDVIHGERAGYHDLITYVQQRSLVEDSVYYHFASEVDVANFILYNVVQVYLNNTDWPGNNNKFWRPDGGRWRWILFDTDFGFGLASSDDYANNSLYRAINAEAAGWRDQNYNTTLLRAALDNEGFRNRLVNRFADEMNSRLLPERIVRHVDTLAAAIAPELPRHFARWDRDFTAWTARLERMKDFAARRPEAMKRHILQQFGLTDYHPLTIANADPAAGYVHFNTLTVTEMAWTGDYFADVPVQLTAVARSGHAFDHWTGDVFSDDPILTVNPNRALRIVPVFRAVAQEPATAVINEIHYASDPDADTGDWIELYNPGSDPLDLSDWTLRDSDDTHAFRLPPGTILPPDGYLILAQDAIRFTMLHPTEVGVVGGMDFGLSREGDAVRLFNRSEQLQDEVVYTATAPWPADFAGADRTIALRDPGTDNARGQHWVIDAYGTPRRANRPRSEPAFDGVVTPVELALRPNPTAGEASLRVSLFEAGEVTVQLFDVTGRPIATLFTGRLPIGETYLSLDVSTLPVGTYLLRVMGGQGELPVSLRLLRT